MEEGKTVIRRDVHLYAREYSQYKLAVNEAEKPEPSRDSDSKPCNLCGAQLPSEEWDGHLRSVHGA